MLHILKIVNKNLRYAVSVFETNVSKRRNMKTAFYTIEGIDACECFAFLTALIKTFGFILVIEKGRDTIKLFIVLCEKLCIHTERIATLSIVIKPRIIFWLFTVYWLLPASAGENNNGEFDPGSERTLAARFKHASRTVGSACTSESGERVSNT